MTAANDENEILRFAQGNNAVKAKALIEIVNSIDCARAQIDVSRQRQGWLNRLTDSFTGKTAQRQILTEANLLNGLENLWQVAQSLTLNQTTLANVASKLAEDVRLLQENMAMVGGKLLGLRDRLDHFQNSVSGRLAELERRVDRVSILNDAQRQLEACAYSLKLGHYAQFSPPAQLYLAASDLYYGKFHEAISRYPEEKAQLTIIAAGKLGEALAQVSGIPPASPQPWRIWQPAPQTAVEEQIISYLAGPPDCRHRPLTAKIAHPGEAAGSRIPGFISAGKLADRVLDETFESDGACS